MTQTEASKLLGVSTKTIWRWIKSGALKAHKAEGAAPRLSVQDVSAFHASLSPEQVSADLRALRADLKDG